MKTQTSSSLLAALACVALTLPPPAHAEPLATVAVERADVAIRHVAEGVVEAVHSATVAAQVQGRIVDVHVDAGDAVRKGALLMRIDASAANQAVAGAAASVAQAEANTINARAEWQRNVALHGKGFVSQAVVDQAVARLRAAEAGLRAAQAGRGQAVTVRDFTTLEAPLDGVVAERHVSSGDMAQPGRALVTLYDPARLRVIAQLPQSVAQGVAGAALSADVLIPGQASPLTASAVMLVPSADPRTHTMEVRAELPSGTGMLVPGQFARLVLHVGARSQLIVPAAAVLRRGEVTAVYVQTDAGFRMRQVRPGERLPDGRIEILAGLDAGEQVALDPVRASLQPR